MKDMGFNFYSNICSLTWQVALNLIGMDPEENPNTVVLTGSAMDEESEAYKKKPLDIEFATIKSFVRVVSYSLSSVGAQAQ